MIKFQNILKEIQIEKPYILTDEGLELKKNISIIKELSLKYPQLIDEDFINGSEEYSNVWFLDMMGFDETNRKLSLSQMKSNMIQQTEELMWEDNKDMIPILVNAGYLKH